MLKGFRDFIMRGNVVDLAVAVVIGGAFGQVVNSLVADVLTPLIGALGGAPDFSAIKLGPHRLGEVYQRRGKLPGGGGGHLLLDRGAHAGD
jgi:large conductance mechanosensitive channel